ncbi:SGNH/GDSL hydrolase family protein [Patulibacter sp. NPDC049589]|uniref:SGNH/GDSL hydrolase family protein n=1 Tax=Patulibacter sp. NPDC049589 TaxID=3154731 RepID=UPI00344976DB
MPDPPGLPPRPTSAAALALLLAVAVLALAVPGRALAGAYVALGDSYSSGLGAGDESDGACRRSPAAFPAVVAARVPGTTLVTVACAGAKVADVRRDQLGALSPATSLVTITIGGNDAGFTSVIARCALPMWVARCGPPVTRAQRTIRGTLPVRLDGLYAEIRSRAPAARVVVVGYPRLFNGIDCGAFTFFSRDDQRLLNGTADLLRSILRTRARAAGFAFADVVPSFRGHAVCDDREWLNGLSHPLRESFHPNATGHADGYAPAVLRAIGG